METLGIVGVDFFQAVVDETSGTCRSSKELWMRKRNDEATPVTMVDEQELR